jgi:predicted branched-subunit amino acid permease
MVPMAAGIVPFGIALGALIGASDLDTAAALASAPIILAGAAQLATLDMLDTGVSAPIIVVSALLINLRILLYSTSLAPWFASVPLRQRLLLAIPVIDQTHFVCTARFERGDLDERGRVAYYTGAGVLLIITWLASQSLAFAVGASLPESARLEMAAPLALIGLLAKSAGTGPSIVAAGAGVAVAAIGVGLPMHSATLAATVAGIAVAVGVESIARRGGRRRGRAPSRDHGPSRPGSRAS